MLARMLCIVSPKNRKRIVANTIMIRVFTAITGLILDLAMQKLEVNHLEHSSTCPTFINLIILIFIFKFKTMSTGDFLYGWNGKVLRVNLSSGKVIVEKYNADLAMKYVGGRGFAVRILWDELRPGIDPLGSENKLVIAAGPLTGLPGPSLGKLVMAAKSPLTGGYGDGNIGTMAAVYMRKAGIDAVIIEGKAQKPVYLYVENEKGYLLSADGIWGKTTFEAEKELKEIHGKDVGVLVIGPAGENIVRYATVVSQEGRAGGRPGMGAVMGSKKLKAVVFKGVKDIPLADAESYKKLVNEAYNNIKSKDNYTFWIRQGTMAL